MLKLRFSIVGLVLLSISAVGLLTACTANWEVGASCSAQSKCEVHGKMSGTIGSDSRGLINMMSLSSIIDASDFQIDTSGSSVPYPTHGTVTVSLMDASNNSVQAAKLFSWSRSGNIITLDNPGVVNQWASNNQGNADSIAYRLTPFISNYGAGEHTLHADAKYKGVSKASTTITVTGCEAPRGHPREYPCVGS